MSLAIKSAFTAILVLGLAGIVAGDNTASGEFVETWGKCAGQGYDMVLKCEDTSQCVYKNEYYSQCQPKSKGLPSKWPQSKVLEYTGEPLEKSITDPEPEEDDTTNKDDADDPDGTDASGLYIETYEQCAGKNVEGVLRCKENDQCVYQNMWYSQCRPKSSSPPAHWTESKVLEYTGPMSTTVAGMAEDEELVTCLAECATTGGQCGGTPTEGVRECCDESLQCIRKSPFFAQCLPKDRSLLSHWSILKCTPGDDDPSFQPLAQALPQGDDTGSGSTLGGAVGDASTASTTNPSNAQNVPEPSEDAPDTNPDPLDSSRDRSFSPSTSQDSPPSSLDNLPEPSTTTGEGNSMTSVSVSRGTTPDPDEPSPSQEPSETDTPSISPNNLPEPSTTSGVGNSMTSVSVSTGTPQDPEDPEPTPEPSETPEAVPPIVFIPQPEPSPPVSTTEAPAPTPLPTDSAPVDAPAPLPPVEPSADFTPPSVPEPNPAECSPPTNIFDVAYKGELTYYGGAGSGGSCTQTYVPPGFTTVAINAEQYFDGKMCGSCLHACFIPENASRLRCFNAIVDNICPECVAGDLDLGESGSGRLHVDWNEIPCPLRDTGVLVTTQGSNPFYAKVKFEGGPSGVQNVKCLGKGGQGTNDGYWVFEDSSGSMGCGMECEVEFRNGLKVDVWVDASLLGGGAGC